MSKHMPSQMQRFVKLYQSDRQKSPKMIRLTDNFEDRQAGH